MNTPREPNLDQLVAALTAVGEPAELTGRDAAVAAFRTARQPAAAGRIPARKRVFSSAPGLPLRTRLAAAGAALAVAGAVAAAYAQALPDPVQHLAHTAFAPLGVPDGTVSTTSITVANAGGKAKKAASPSAKTSSPRPVVGYLVSVAVPKSRVAPGGVVVFTGQVTLDGRPAADVRVRLYERLAGTTTEEIVTTGMTGPRGRFRLLSPPLTATSVFRVTGPDTVRSIAVRVAVGG